MANSQPLGKTLANALSQLERLSLEPISGWASVLDIPLASAQQLMEFLEKQDIIQRKPQGIELHPQSPVVIGFDLGGTKVKGRLATLAGEVLAQTAHPTRKGDEQAAMQQMSSLAEDLLSQAGVSSQRLKQIAIGIPGSIDKQGNVQLSPNLRLPARLPAVLSLADGKPCPTVFENDVNLAALGEYHYGHGKGSDSLVFVAFGTGVGMGIIAQGGIISGHSGMAGEIALLPLSATPYEDARISVGGVFEDRVSSSAIRQRYQGGNIEVIDIFRQAEQGEPQALAVLENTARIAALGVASAVSLLNPEWLILGGGIGARPAFHERVRQQVEALIPVPVRLTGSALLDDAGVVGAVHLAREACLTALSWHDVGEPA
ncbi:ROK family protein [Musicola paradisiaca]|uniref:ROK family protein n=1 Tax=Musicola paradisiaca (strain Ech703) TaxID=579405 RepID=C6C6G5_MUSP7|nr:ROK family protein [Musicola paradisiaca]ACS83884.1 ROK family protein [Musicola paradisiaca Ech703]